MSALRMLGDRLGVHTFAYGTGSGLALAFGMVNMVVLTRVLPIAVFGRLALLMVLAAGVAILCSLLTVQGGFGWVFGGGADGDDLGDEIDDAERPRASDKAVALTTALVLTLAVGAVGAGLVALVAEPVSEVLYGSDDLAGAVRLAGVAGGLGAAWRLVANIPRLERRPAMYLFLSFVRPVAVLVAMVGMALAVGGVEGAMLGLALGGAVALVVGVTATHGAYGLGFSFADARGIVGRGRLFVPIVLAMWVLQQVDLYLVWAVASDADVARYRVASRIGAGMAFFAAALFAAWNPLVRTGSAKAAMEQVGRGGIGATVLLYFAIGTTWIALALGLFAYELISIAPAAYASAAPLIPLVGLAFAAHGAFTAVYRVSPLPGKTRLYAWLLVAGALLFVPIGYPLVSWLGAYGAPLAQIAVMLPAAAVILVLTQRDRETAMPIAWRRVGRAVGLALACFVVARGAALALPELRFAFDVVAIAAFPLLALRWRVVPSGHRDFLLEQAFPGRRARRPGARRWLVDGLATLGRRDRKLLEMIARKRRGVDWVAALVGVEETVVRLRVAHALRELGGFGRWTPLDDEIVRYLLSAGAVAQRDDQLRRLWERGADPLDVEGMERLLAGLRRLPARAWRALDEAPSLSGPAPLAADPRAPLLVLAGRDPEAGAPGERDG